MRYDIPCLITTTQIGRMANYHPLVIKEMATFIKSKIEQPINYGDKIYISRSKATKRKISNESEVEIYLENLGFRKIHFEDHSFIEQVSIMHHCKKLIGVHGAGLANMIFMNAHGRVMELRKHDAGENYFYFSLASTVDLDYYYQFCDSVDGGTSVQDADILVDIVELKENLKIMLS